MIRNYKQFIEDTNTTNTIGEYIEGLCVEPNVKDIVNKYIIDVAPYISISNAVNSLEDIKRVKLLREVEEYVNIEDIDEGFGKGVFTTFLKCLTSLGLKDSSVSKEIPENYLIFLKYTNLDPKVVSQIFNRFKSLKDIKLSDRNIGLYFGITLDNTISYGIYGDVLEKIGEFKLTKQAYNRLKISELKALSGFKKFISLLDYNDIILMSKLKKVLSSYTPGYYKMKMDPLIKDKIITFGYYGYGKWDNGVIEQKDLDSIKDSINVYLLKYKFSNSFLINITKSDFWVYLNFKIK